ncbi:MAG: acyl-CoA/acyl-ACP dehydrogenase [Chloroflexi bacterium]|nr:acyl-CoA/acyl-ACP dehydrogenase [Chloroflexota bacterium]
MSRLDIAAIRELAATLAARESVDSETYPAANIDDMKQAGVHRGPLPPALGGLGWSLPDAVRAIEAISGGSGSAGLLVAMPAGLAGIYGSGIEAPAAHAAAWRAQVDDVAARITRGEWYAACNSERGAGGSLAATKTAVARESGGGFRISGEKILASAGRYADHFLSTAKVQPEDLPGCGIVEFFFVKPDGAGVEVLDDWDGFGMRSTESNTVRYTEAPTEGLMGFPNFLEVAQPLGYWYCLFAAIPLGCAGAILRALATPTPQSPALRVRFNDATMRYEALLAYLLETAAMWRPAGGPKLAARVLRTKTYVTAEATKLAAELFALGGGRHYSRKSPIARAFADSFAGTALRPPLPLGLEMLAENLSLGAAADD